MQKNSKLDLEVLESARSEIEGVCLCIYSVVGHTVSYPRLRGRILVAIHMGTTYVVMVAQHSSESKSILTDT